MPDEFLNAVVQSRSFRCRAMDTRRPARRFPPLPPPGRKGRIGSGTRLDTRRGSRAADSRQVIGALPDTGEKWSIRCHLPAAFQCVAIFGLPTRQGFVTHGRYVLRHWACALVGDFPVGSAGNEIRLLDRISYLAKGWVPPLQSLPAKPQKRELPTHLRQRSCAI